MSRERELLKECALQLGNENMTYWNAGLVKEIEDFLSTPEPTQDEEPIYQISLATGRATSSAWIDVTKDQYDDAGMYPEYERRTLFLHPAPRPEFVRLTEEELVTCWGMPYSLSTEELRRFARAVEKATWEKNRG